MDYRVILLLVVVGACALMLKVRKDQRWRTGRRVGLTAKDHYDTLGNGDLIGPECSYINMGLWDGVSPWEPRCASKACMQLTKHVAHAGGLLPTETESAASGITEQSREAESGEAGKILRVVDAGCGYGAACFYLAEKAVQAYKIIGVNISKIQLDRCRANAHMAKQWRRVTSGERLYEVAGEGRIEFIEASCTALPFPSDSVNCVWSLEASHHFSTRRQFFDEAFHVLVSGASSVAPNGNVATRLGSKNAGRLVWADVVIPPPSTRWQRFLFHWISSMMGVPPKNLGAIEVVKEELRAAGFRDELLYEEDITQRTIAAFRRYVFTAGLSHFVRNPLSLILPGLCWMLLPMQYHLLVCEK